MLFGFGAAAIAARLDSAGWTRSQRDAMLYRRSFWLILLGVAQVVLVFWVDILAVHGLTAFVLIWLLVAWREPQSRSSSSV